MKKLSFIVVLVASAICTIAQAPKEIEKASGNWYASFMANKQVGYIHELYESRGNENLLTASNRIALTRGATTAEVTVESIYAEDSKTGQLTSIYSIMKMSNQATINQFINGSDSITLTQEIGGKKYTRKLQAKEKVYGPHWIMQNSISRLQKIGDAFQFKTYSPDFGLYLSGSRSVVGSERVEDQDLLIVEEAFVEMPVKRKLWVTPEFGIVKMLDVTPFGPMESLLTTREKALSNASVVAMPAEFFNRTFAKSNVRLSNARSIQSITLRVQKRKDAIVQIPDLNNEFQQEVEKTGDYTVLKITMPEMLKRPLALGKNSNSNLNDYFQANSLINSDDATIVSLAKEITKDITSTYDKCLALETWVTRNMNFDMGIVLAPASEVVKERKGTCASYTTLLTAMFRAIGVPARYNMGFVYMGGIWGGHAWPDAFIDGQWIPFDAAVNGAGTADAARFSFGSTSLKNGAGELSAMPGGLLYGSVDVEVLEYTIDGQLHRPSNKPYVLNELGYANENLALKIRKPYNFNIEDLDRTWPDYTIASLVSNDKKEKVTVVQTMAKTGLEKDEAIRELLLKQVPNGKFSKTKFMSEKVFQVDASREAAIAVPRGQDIWIIRATGPQPAVLLKQALNWIAL